MAGKLYALPDDQQQAIEIFADSARYAEQEGKAIYQGNVYMTQGSLKLEADRVELEQQHSNLYATGQPARFEQQPAIDKPIVKGHANSVLYKQQEGHIELVGNAYLQQGESNIKSDRIVYNVNKQTLEASNSANGEGKPGRVHVIIPPASKDSEEQK